jgi:tRNA threonylcarbamoyladenosine biosynthesis protein TsaB
MLLAIETATELVGAALAGEDGVSAATWATGRRRHAETLAPMLATLLEQAGVRPHQLGAVAVDVGPGLFTGLRVGIATAKGLAFAAGIPVVTVTSVAALAYAAFDAGATGEVLAVVDARRGEVFAGRFGPPGPDGRPVARHEPRRYEPPALREVLNAHLPADGPLMVVGDGALRYADLLTPVPGVHLAGRSLASPSPAAVAALGLYGWAAGEAVDPASVGACYLRDAEVRINWAVRRGAADPAAGGSP